MNFQDESEKYFARKTLFKTKIVLDSLKCFFASGSASSIERNNDEIPTGLLIESVFSKYSRIINRIIVKSGEKKERNSFYARD